MLARYRGLSYLCCWHCRPSVQINKVCDIFFVLTNIIISPLTWLVLVLAACYFLLLPFPGFSIMFLTPLSFVTDLMVKVLEWIVSLPFSCISGLYINVRQTIALYVCMVCLTIVFKKLCRGLYLSRKQDI